MPLLPSNDSSPLPPIEVSAGLIFRDGKLLVTQRYPEAHQGGLWEFPGGKLEPNETFEQCLAREIREELGIEIDIYEPVETITHAYPEKIVTLKFFRCAWKSNEPRPLGCPDFRWLTREELENYQFPPADARLLEKLRNHSEWWGAIF